LALAKDFAPYVRVNGVAPGAILWAEDAEASSLSSAAASASTSSSAIELKNKEILKKIPMGRKGDPHHIASTVEFLACEAGYITGQMINVDGGRSLNQ
jgi:pteridine reductase